MAGTGSPAIVIAGCGFGGIGLAVRLRKAGIRSFTILERADDVGGVWRENDYPGAGCDVPSRFYSFSFDQDYPWSRRWAPQGEILDYLRRCVARHGIAPHIRFGTEVREARFDARTGKWTIVTGTGERLEADVFVSAVGLFNRPAFPAIPGRDGFRGAQFHSARWDHGVDLAGKSVAVVGTGASAIQFVPAIEPQVGRLDVFQRSAQYVLPKNDPGTPPPGRTMLHRLIARFRTYWLFETGIPRRSSERMTAAGQAGFFAYLAAKVPDPDLRRRLTPDYPLGCKRVLFSDQWFDAIQRPNVALHHDPVAEILPDGVRTRSGATHRCDVIVYGTGFTTTDYLTPMRIVGLAGRELNDAWRDGVEAYLGLTVAGFPNFFMMYGPNTNVPGSIVYMLESQARYIVDAVRKLRRARGRFADLRPAAQRRFNQTLQRRLARTVLVRPNCHSYYRDATGKVTVNWPGFMLEYRLRTWRIRRADYDFVPVGARAARPEGQPQAAE